MEIVIRTEGENVGVRDTGSQAGGQGAQQEAAPPPAVAAQAAAVGAINAGPARIPSGPSGQPLPDIGALAAQVTGAAGGGDTAAASAGAAPGVGPEPEETLVEGSED